MHAFLSHISRSSPDEVPYNSNMSPFQQHIHHLPDLQLLFWPLQIVSSQISIDCFLFDVCVCVCFERGVFDDDDDDDLFSYLIYSYSNIYIMCVQNIQVIFFSLSTIPRKKILFNKNQMRPRRFQLRFWCISRTRLCVCVRERERESTTK